MTNQSMSGPSLATTINCTQCGGELHPDEGQVFLSCPFCGTTVYLDSSRVVFHWFVAPTLNEELAGAALRRWMSGAQTVKDLDKKASISGCTFQYFPLWYFKRQVSANKEEILLRPAAATSVTELASLTLPAGDLRKYDPALDSQAVAPTVPLQAALSWVQASQPGTAHTALPGSLGADERLQNAAPETGSVTKSTLPDGMKETAVVHVPLYFFKYHFKGSTYTAVVDAAGGTVLANLFPAKEEAPYRAVGLVTALLYLCLALFPLVGAISDSEIGLTYGLVACAGIGALAAPFLFAWAFWVASKV